MNKWTIGLLILLNVVTGGVVGGLLSAPALTPAPAPRVGLAEVSDLIARLKPLAKNPDRPWYENGIQVTFYGSSVDIVLKLPNGNEYHGRADTLREAVSRITEPSVDIQNALEGWSAPK